MHETNELALRARVEAEKPLSEELRATIAKYAETQKAKGTPKTKVAELLGLKSNTLHKLCQRARKPKPQFIELTTVAKAAPAYALEVTFPNGFIVRSTEAVSEIKLQTLLKWVSEK